MEQLTPSTHCLSPDLHRCHISGRFCLASQNICDGLTKCGNPIKSASECFEAATELGLNSTVIELDSGDAPHGCFQAILDDQQPPVFYNNNTAAYTTTSEYSFAKSLCRTRKTGAVNRYKTDIAHPPHYCACFVQSLIW